jgi:hypothetical protein
MPLLKAADRKMASFSSAEEEKDGIGPFFMGRCFRRFRGGDY